MILVIIVFEMKIVYYNIAINVDSILHNKKLAISNQLSLYLHCDSFDFLVNF